MTLIILLLSVDLHQWLFIYQSFMHGMFLFLLDIRSLVFVTYLWPKLPSWIFGIVIGVKYSFTARVTRTIWFEIFFVYNMWSENSYFVPNIYSWVIYSRYRWVLYCCHTWPGNNNFLPSWSYIDESSVFSQNKYMLNMDVEYEIKSWWGKYTKYYDTYFHCHKRPIGHFLLCFGRWVQVF